MGLDPDTAALLKQMSDGDAPPLYELSVADARAALKDLTLAMDVERESVASVVDEQLTIGANESFGIRIYQPSEQPAQASSPGVLVLMHGGGWALGDLDSHDSVSRFFCNHAGRVVISVDYRLAPEHPFPAGLNDCIEATRWASENAGRLGANAEDLAVIGDSAGGNLAAVVCQIARQSDGPGISKQVLLYPSLDINAEADFPSREQFGGGEYFLSLADLRWLRDMYLPGGAAHRDARASPLYARDLTELPRTLVITAGHDLLRDEARAYVDRLEAAGNAVTYRNFDTTIHGFCSFAGALAPGREALDYVAAWLRA